MITRHLPRRALGALLALMTALAAGAPSASADPGPAPAPREYRVLQKLHTDAVSTFLDAGTFALGTKADVFEGNGTRLDPDKTWFHVDDASKLTVPAGFEFIAPAGSDVWVAPQSNTGGDQLWPGFSTESVPVGAIDGDETTLRLVKVEGPGALELFTTGAIGGVTRLWSSDESIDTFRVGRTHMHANWAFTKAGSYRVTVEASAKRGAQPVSATATYTFVVGPLPAAATTTTALSASATELTATVAPATAAGFVELREGTEVIAHARVTDGKATFATDLLAPGTHTVTAAFVPEVLNLAARSTSSPVTVTVAGQSFGIAGVAASYQPGDALDARVVGATLGTGQNYQWRIRPAGSTGAGTSITGTGGTAATGRLQQRLDASYGGYELSVRLRTGTTVDQQTDWTPITVANAVEPLTAKLVKDGPIHLGEEIVVQLGGRALAAGETLQMATRTSGLWFVMPWAHQRDATSFLVQPLSDDPGATWTVQVVRDGMVVAQSTPFAADVREREVLVEGIQGVYRAGQTLRASATVHPDLPGLTYQWLLLDLTTFQSTVVGREKTLELPITLAHDKQQLTFAAVWDYGTEVVFVGQKGTPINVSAADPSTQLFFFNGLGDHYHQGGSIGLGLVADPALAAGDTVAWEWKWAGQDWIPFDGAPGLSRTLVAEQALDGVQVRARLTFATGGAPVEAEPVTIHVDDHGAPANQKVTVRGETAYTAGDTATLSADVTPATVLDTYQWYDGGTPIPGATGKTYTFTATADRKLTVAVRKPNGALAYGPSTPVDITVRERAVEVPQTVGGSVPPTLSLTLSAPASFGAFTPGVERDYTATTKATVVSSAGDATLTVSDPSPTHAGHLVNGAFALAQPLQGLGTLKTYAAPVTGDEVPVTFTQRINAGDALRTGTYAKTLTFTLATTAP
ncbi:choice-of-anchor M domain-containing protein [Solirubrobacter phytolaccae]|uniref:Choice-of-anchor M domain-containing protein n=1 Tax=Solirubrobacter phytolaccae TaxID=1404360 RepID=A0A9X3SD37_9ACTN|nr:choice-of-anchor M domain-containing protein [Solirubrobacter phytolaccae]MDA0185376.1 choice-of-anchor M domain-containing protein [Solirubrobacter phytolaccae]